MPELTHHEVHIRHHDGGTAPSVMQLRTGPAFLMGEPMGLMLKTSIDRDRPGTMVHKIDAQSIIGGLDTPDRVAEYLEAVASTIRQAHLYQSTEDNPA